MLIFFAGLVTAPAAATFGIMVAVLWTLFFRTVPLHKSKDRFMYCFLHGAALYIFVSFTIISLADWDLLTKVIKDQFGQGELIAVFIAASVEAFTALIRVCKNISTLD